MTRRRTGTEQPSSRSRAPCVGLLVRPESQVGLLALVLERAGKWKCDRAVFAPPPAEPPDWDVVLVDISAEAILGRVGEHFGTSAPVIAVVKQSTDLLAWWRELEGADGFVFETVDPAELIVRTGKAMNAHERGHMIRAGRVCVDLLRHTVSVGGFSTELTSGEALVLGILARASGRWSHPVDLVEALGSVHQTSDTVWQHVHRLRVKLGPCQAVLETSRARGYRLNPCAKFAGAVAPGT